MANYYSIWFIIEEIIVGICIQIKPKQPDAVIISSNTAQRKGKQNKVLRQSNGQKCFNNADFCSFHVKEIKMSDLPTNSFLAFANQRQSPSVVFTTILPDWKRQTKVKAVIKPPHYYFCVIEKISLLLACNYN